MKQNKMTLIKNILSRLSVILAVTTIAFTLFACGGGGSSSTEITESTSETPNFTPDSSNLKSLVVNTCTDKGIDITVDPTYIDFTYLNGEIEIDDEFIEPFTITNDSGDSQTFQLEIYAVSGGFSIVNSEGINTGNWENITLGDGDEQSFSAKYLASEFGEQISYVTITVDSDCYIQLPLGANVTGDADLRILQTGYSCSDEDAPEIDYVDFNAVAYNQSSVQGIKLCNGGEEIKINSATIENDDDIEYSSAALDANAFEGVEWTTSETITSAFAFGTSPASTSSFSEPDYENYEDTIDDAAKDFSIAVNHTGEAVDNLTLEAGKILFLDIEFTPSVDFAASEGSVYNPEAMNALLTLDTTLGEIYIPLVAATTGSEPYLRISYKQENEEQWREFDLSSDGPAMYFGTVDVFMDWVTDNYQTIEFKIENLGSGKSLDFYGDDIQGYFEYIWEDDEELSFPLSIAAMDSETIQLRYLPTPSSYPDSNYWDFGQLTVSHDGANGPEHMLTLVGEQNPNYAVEFKLGGSILKREYDVNEYKNFCVFKTNDGSGETTQKTFKLVNNHPEHTLTASWSISSTEGSFNSSPSSGSLTVAPLESENFEVDFTANNTDPLKGTINLNASYGTLESTYSSYLTSAESRDFTVPFKAVGSESGQSVLCSGEILGVVDEEAGTDTRDVTVLVKDFIMGMTSLLESTRDYPNSKFHFKLRIDEEAGTVILPETIQPVFDMDDPAFSRVNQLYTPLHQGTNNGCPVLPSNPYRQEYERASWTGPGYSCEIAYNKPTGESVSFYTDTACMADNMGTTALDIDGTTWNVVYHDFFKFDTDTCELLYHGQIATMAWPDGGSVTDVLDEFDANPTENESFYESLARAYEFNSYIQINDESYKSACGGKDLVEDPDEVKDCYLALSGDTEAKRAYGFVDECAHFYYIFKAGEDNFGDGDDECNQDNVDNCISAGFYEKHVDDFGKTHDTKYDLTIHNLNITAMMIQAGDRTSFFGHPSHTLYANFDVTVTTKRVAEESWENDGNWLERIATTTRPHVSKKNVFIEDGNPYSIGRFWTEDGKSSELCSAVDCTDMPGGVDQGGYGKGNFRFISGSNDQRIILSGWPINYDENNFIILTGIGKFAGGQNSSPSFASADSATGLGKVISFSMFGCVLPGELDENQGCLDYGLDSTVMPAGGSGSAGEDVIDTYEDFGILPGGYVENEADCSLLADPGFNDPDDEDYDPYLYMACINYKIDAIDRDRYKNYYDSTKFIFEADPYGTSSICGYGM
jgi:hypothetical protein